MGLNDNRGIDLLVLDGDVFSGTGPGCVSPAGLRERPPVLVLVLTAGGF